MYLCKDVSLVVKNDLFNFGFIIAEEKSNWNPVQESIWLGLIWYTVAGKIRVTQYRIDKILSCLRYICNNLQTTRVIPVGLLASVIGQLISIVLGGLVGKILFSIVLGGLVGKILF
jgi:hypothetical protein